MNTTEATEQIIRVPLIAISASPLNPRKHFPQAYIEELALNINNNGQINPMIVRRWPASPDYSAPPGVAFEIACGECRWRAMKLKDDPERMGSIIVRELSDATMLELMVSENMKRRDLSPLEELDAFSRMMKQKGEDGAALYPTRAALAQKIGVNEMYVTRRLSLEKLGKAGRKALAQEVISSKLAEMICASPASIIANVEEEVLHPPQQPWEAERGVLTASETADLIKEKYARALRRTPFELNQAGLVPVVHGKDGERLEGGACTDCPWRSSQAAPGSGASRKGMRGGRAAGEENFCLNPACFQKKVDVHVAAELLKAREDGCEVLSKEESDKVLYDHGSLKHNSQYVDLDEKPDEADRARNIPEKQMPTWGKLIEGESLPPIHVAVDGNGGVHRLVPKKLAEEAARVNKKDKFLSRSSGSGSVRGEDNEEKRRREAAKQRGDQARGVLEEIVGRIVALGIPEGFWGAMRGLMVQHAGNAGCSLVCSRREIEKKPYVTDATRQALNGAEGNELAAFCVELLLSESFSVVGAQYYNGGAVPDEAKPLVELLGIDAAAIGKALKKEKASKRNPSKGELRNKPPQKLIGDEVPSFMKKNVKRPKARKGPKLLPVERKKIVKALKARWARYQKKTSSKK